MGLEQVLQLNAKRYNYKTEEYPQLGLADGTNYGLIAQEVEEVMPFLVSEMNHPKITDEDGAVLAEPVEFKGVEYVELIPVLVQAIQDQNDIVETQAAQISSLQEQLNSLATDLASCCASEATYSSFQGNSNDMQIIVPEILSTETDDLENSLDQNYPNPFNTNTIINYSLTSHCQASIKIFGSNGQLVAVLIDQNHMMGNHSVQWNASGLAPGIYFYSLVVEGVEMVKRAVKID